MNTYKSLGTTILILLFSFNFISCSSDDDENLPNPDAPKKRITQIFSTIYGDTETAKFEYSGEKVSKITVTRTGESKPWTTEFEYDSNEVKIHSENLWFEGEPKSTRTFTLNNQGYIDSYKDEFMEDTYYDKYSYSNDYLILVDYGDPYGDKREFKYDHNGNMIKNDEFDKITYSNVHNLGGLYLNYDNNTIGIVFPEFYANLLGKPSPYLPQEAQYEPDREGIVTHTFNYDFDNDGYVRSISIKVHGDDYSDTWTESYTYEVIE